MQSKILVVGCGRSGTLHITNIFKILGLEVGHEELKENGISSWFHSFGSRQHNLIERELKDHKLIFIHLVRNPIKVIESIALVSLYESRYALGYFKDTCPRSAENYKGFQLAMTYWVYWNKMVEKHNPINLRIKVEDLSTQKGLKNLCKVVGVDYSFKKLASVKFLGKKQHALPDSDKKELLKNNPHFKTGIIADDLREIDPKLFNKVKSLAVKYDYHI